MIRIFATGGTIDSEKYEPATGKCSFSETHIPQMLEQARNRVPVEVEVLMLKDSREMTNEDREKIMEKCKACAEDKIIITHGTVTLPETARFLGERIKEKTIVLLGAMVPYNREKSDAPFNLGSAIAAVQLLPKGVYVAMNGKIFPWDNVRKNRKKGEFEEIKPAL